jgi:hypothetical protein
MNWFRKLKLKNYKNRKVRKQKTPTNRHYAVKFRIKIKDENHPHIIDETFDMVVPAKAAFFAKRKLYECILDKVEIKFDDVNKITYEEWEQHERDRKECNNKIKGQTT